MRSAVCAMLLLAGCNDDLRPASESDVESIAADVAADATAPRFSELESRIEELESEVRLLRAESGLHAAELDRLGRNDKADTENIDRIYKAHNSLLNEYREHRHY